MPMYDYLYGTADKSSDSLYEASHKGRKGMPDVVHLTHPTTLHSIYHLRLGFAGFASKPYASKWYLWAIWPVTWASMFLTWMFGSTFTVERNRLDKLKMQTWSIPRYTCQVRDVYLYLSALHNSITLCHVFWWVYSRSLMDSICSVYCHGEELQSIASLRRPY